MQCTSQPHSARIAPVTICFWPLHDSHIAPPPCHRNRQIITLLRLMQRTRAPGALSDRRDPGNLYRLFPSSRRRCMQQLYGCSDCLKVTGQNVRCSYVSYCCLEMHWTFGSVSTSSYAFVQVHNLHCRTSMPCSGATHCVLLCLLDRASSY